MPTLIIGECGTFNNKAGPWYARYFGWDGVGIPEYYTAHRVQRIITI